MKFVIGVDGGQSTTLALVASEAGHILGEGIAGPSNHIHESGGPERLEAAVHRSIESALQNSALRPEQVSSICLGMTGGAQLAAKIVAAMFPAAIVRSYDDMVTAHAGATTGQPGVVVIAGTGSVAYGRLGNGQDAKAGGWGYLLGDEGSGYSIGLAALRAICQAADGRAPQTRLTADILAQIGFANLMELQRATYSGDISRPQIAGLTALVGVAANAGDRIAQGLLHVAGKDLAQAVIAVLEKLDSFELPVFTTGGVFRAGAPLLNSFEATVRARSRTTTICPAAFSPSIGAVLMALQAIDVSLTDPNCATVQMIRASLLPSAISKSG